MLLKARVRVKHAESAGCASYSFLQRPDLFPGLHVFASGLQKLLVGQIEGLTDGESYLLRLQQESKDAMMIFT